MRSLPFLLLLVACDAATIQIDDSGKTGTGDPDDTGSPDDTGDTDDTGSEVSGAIEVSPVDVELPVLFLGSSSSTSFAITNVGTGPTDVSLTVVGGRAAEWTLDAYTAAPAPGTTVTQYATATPTTWGDYSVSVVVSDALSGGEVEVKIKLAVQVDADHDGVGSLETGGEDCDDALASTYPGAEDAWYDGVDSNCDGADDYDQDADGVTVDTDCNDTDASVYPGAADTWYDGIDSDCAGNDDYDQDADGFADEDYGGDDCNDEDAALNPAATEVWYDGVDANCDGADDYDQDGDGYVSADYGGDDCDDTDAAVNTGATEVWYDGVDGDCSGGSDYDQDGDGTVYPTDCNDTDPTTTGPTDESWNGLDDDCNGLVDDFSATDAAAGILYGYSSSLGVGDHGRFGIGSDVTGDGAADLVAVGVGTYGYTWVVSGATAASTVADLDDVDTAMITGDSQYYPLATVNGPFSDASGDGTADLLVGGAYGSTYYTYARVYGFEGGSGLSGALSAGDSDSLYEGDSSSYVDYTSQGITVDLDGDGTAEVVIGAAYDNYGSSESDAGSVSIFTSFSGDTTIASSTDRIYGTDEREYLGYQLVSAGDATGDGYEDFLAASPGYDGGSGDGAVFLVPGNASLSWDTRVDDASSAWLQAASSGEDIGDDTLAHPGDVNGDGDLDVGITSESDGEVWLFLGAGSLSGAVDLSDADHNFVGTAGDLGSSLAMDSDLDGDGADELVIGADGDDTAGSNYGAAYVFSWSSGWGSALSSSDARGVIWGTASNEYFGTGAAGGADLDGDGTEDVVIGAAANSTTASSGGALYIVTGW